YAARIACLLVSLAVVSLSGHPLPISRLAVATVSLVFLAACVLPLTRAIESLNVQLLHGRFFLSGLMPAAILLATPVAALLPMNNRGWAVASGFSGLLAAGGLLTGITSIVPAFTPPELSRAEIANAPRNVGADFSGYFTLLGYTTDHPRLEPG